MFKECMQTSRSKAFPKSPVLLLLCLILALLTALSGCGTVNPEREGANEDGSVSMGKRVTILPSEDDFRFYEKSDALAADGTYYATFVTGDAASHLNEDGKEAELYPAQLYLLSYEGTDASDAAQKTAAWMAAAKQQYQTGEEETESIGDFSWTVLPYQPLSATSPYSGGFCAFTTKGDLSLYADLVYTENWAGSAEDALWEELARITYQ